MTETKIQSVTGTEKTRALVRNPLLHSSGVSEILDRVLDFPSTPQGAQRNPDRVLRNKMSPANGSALEFNIG